METPIEATLEALKIFKGMSILNAAPASSNLPEIAFKSCKIFCANELEAEELTKIHFNEISDAKKIVHSLVNEKGCKTAIVTLGKLGAVFNDNEGRIIHVPVQENVQAVDSTGVC